MPHGPKSTEQIPDCKLKRVYPRLPLCVHSAVPKGLAGNRSGNPCRPEPTDGDAVRGSKWSADYLRIRFENALISEAWRRLESAAHRHGKTVDDCFLLRVEEAS